MRLPLQKQTDDQQRQAFRRLIWSLCLVAPSSLLVADEISDKQAEPNPAPSLTLPSFPTTLPPSPIAQPTKSLETAGQSTAGQSTAGQSATSRPLLVTPATASPTTATVRSNATNGTSSGPALLPPLPTAPPSPTPAAASPVSPVPASKPGSNSVGKPNQNDTKINVRVGANGQESVSIKFGSQPVPAAPVGQPAATSSSATADKAKRNQEPASFRLSDKPATVSQSATIPPTSSQTSASKVLPPAAPAVLKATDANDVTAKLPAAPSLNLSPPATLPAPNASGANALAGPLSSPVPAVPSNIAAVPNAKADPSAKAVATAKPGEVKSDATSSVAPKAAESPATQMGALTVAPSGMKPSSPEKNELKRDAILIRPKAIVLGQQPSAMAGNTESVQASTPPASNAPAKTTQVAVVKPSTTPQFVAGKTENTTPHKMKDVDSKVSALPPSQQSKQIPQPAASGGGPNLPAPPMIIAALPLDVTATSSDAPKAAEVAKQDAATASVPALATTAPSIAKPMTPESLTGKDGEIINLADSPDAIPPVVVDAEKIPDATLASVKKYSKPADRKIQVGTVALTTIRVGEKDVVKCEVDDTSVCRAIVTADGEVALLPGKVGVTRATLWIEEANGEPKMETADIQVGEILPLESTAAVEITKLNENLQRLYPNTTLRIVPSDRCIEICGEADTEQQAREVLQLIRKLCLVPVKDKITVR